MYAVAASSNELVADMVDKLIVRAFNPYLINNDISVDKIVAEVRVMFGDAAARTVAFPSTDADRAISPARPRRRSPRSRQAQSATRRAQRVHHRARRLAELGPRLDHDAVRGPDRLGAARRPARARLRGDRAGTAQRIVPHAITVEIAAERFSMPLLRRETHAGIVETVLYEMTAP